jgi:2-polyprenyl-6-methoxyphenol hydroxylase-like FAD-dependent oxidoreductase
MIDDRLRMSDPVVRVIGAGPAGVSLAVNLARSGLAVELWDGGPPRPLLEGYSHRTLRLLNEAGLYAAAALPGGPVPRVGIWGTRAASGEEWLADRADLHTALLEDAAAVGVRIVHRRYATDPSGAINVGAGPLIVRAVGRQGPAITGPPLLAVTGKASVDHAEPGTHIGTWSGGWFWVAQREDRTQLQLVGRPRSGRPRDWFRLFANEYPQWADVAQQAAVRFTARAAQARLTRELDCLSRVGDAALAVDPLSGHGVYEALAAIPAQAAAVRTTIEGDAPGLARAFLTARRQEVWRRTVVAAGGFYAELAETGAFWRETAAAYQQLEAGSSDVQAQKARIEKRPVLEFGYIREREVVITPDQPRGVWQVDGVPILLLRQYLQSGVGSDACAAAARLNCPVQSIRRATGWLQAAGLLGTDPAIVSGEETGTWQKAD